MISIRKTFVNQVPKFANECFEYFREYNGDYTYHGEFQEVYIVNNNIKDVGLFTVEISLDGKEIRPMYWAHPKVCKMGLLTIQKAAAIHCYARAYKENIDYVFFKFKDALSSRTIRRLCPGTVEHLIDINYYLCVCRLRDIQNIYTVDDKYCFELEF